VSNIFLSYRRDDAGGWAGRLSDSLRKALPGAVVFMDVDNIPPGVRFADYIKDAVAKCQVLIVLIGPHWASEKNLQRLQDQKDFVHAEIAAALKLGVRVIPTRVGEAPLPASASLPEDLRELLDRNDFVISDRSWDDDCRRLSEALRPLVGGSGTSGGPSKFTRGVVIAGLAAALLGASIWVVRSLRSDGPTTVESAPVVAATSPATVSSSPQPTPAQPRDIFDLRLGGSWGIQILNSKDTGLGDLVIDQGPGTLVFTVVENAGAQASSRTKQVGSVQLTDRGFAFSATEGKLRATIEPTSKPGVWAMSFHEGAEERAVASGDVQAEPGARRWSGTLQSPKGAIEFKGELSDDDSVFRFEARGVEKPFAFVLTKRK